MPTTAIERSMCPFIRAIQEDKDPDDGTECILLDHYFCPVAAIPWMDLAILRDLPDCPYSWD